MQICIMLNTGDFVKVTNTELMYCLNGIVADANSSTGTARIFCPELEVEFIVGEERPLSLHVCENGHYLVKKILAE